MCAIFNSLYFSGKYKMNLFTTYDIGITIGERDLYIEGLRLLGNSHKDFQSYCVSVRHIDVSNISIIDMFGRKYIKIEYTRSNITIAQSIYISGIDNLSKCYDSINEAVKRRKQYFADCENRAFLQQQQAAEQSRIYEEESKKFYDDCYNFHIKDGTKRFDVLADKNKLVTIFVDENKSLRFLQIDGYKRLEDVGVITYDNIHYYERAGAVHYVSETNGDLTNTSGQFTGASISKAAVLTSGILFGAMGLATAALMSYKPAQSTPSETHLSLKSEARRIDERSVILNYYSLEEKQFVDMELPQEIFNYLQTYLPEKKYDIVKEIERHTAVSKASVSELPPPEKAKELPSDEKLSIDEFKEKVEKLKFMHDAGLLDDAEFEAEKKKLLQNL